MDWARAIERNREALRRILAALLAMAGLSAHRPATLPRHLHRAVLRLLRPAEAAARRLVVIAARDLAVPPPAPKPSRSGPGGSGGHAALPLVDNLPGFRPRRPRFAPRISVPGHTVSALPRRSPPTPFDAIDAARLGVRLGALAAVLDDLPAHARRFARWQARQAALREQGAHLAATSGRGRRGSRRRFGRLSPLRPGRPPGSLRKPFHEVHQVLAEVHGLARWAMALPDTS